MNVCTELVKFIMKKNINMSFDVLVIYIYIRYRNRDFVIYCSTLS